MADNDIHERPISNPDEQQAEPESVSTPNEESSPAPPKVKRLRGWYLYVILLIVVAGAIFMPAIGMSTALHLLENWGLQEIGDDLEDFLQTENKSLFSVETWCDSMLKIEDEYHSITRYENHKTDFPYTLNKHIQGLESIPDNMVVLFKAEPGWNQVGDIDSVKKQERLLVLLGDGTTSVFRKRQIPHLRWKFEDSGVIPAPDIKNPLTVMSVSLGFVFLVILLALKRYVKIYLVLAVCVGIASAAVAVWFGFMAEGGYYKMNTAGSYLAPWPEIVWGFATGVAFIAIIGRIFSKYKSNVSMVGYATVIGAITGIAASSIVHGYLMVAYEEKNFSYMIAGSCFGIMAGLLLGWVSSGLIRFYSRTQKAVVENEKA